MNLLIFTMYIPPRQTRLSPCIVPDCGAFALHGHCSRHYMVSIPAGTGSSSIPSVTTCIDVAPAKVNNKLHDCSVNHTPPTKKQVRKKKRLQTPIMPLAQWYAFVFGLGLAISRCM